MARVAAFPGQGAQQPGMGKALHDAFPEARAVFEEVDAALGENLSALVFAGPAERLTLTANAQPALMATSLAALRAVEAMSGRRLPQIASFVAGHSLGEYSALAAAGAVGIADAACLLRLRGEAMQAAVPAGEGAMAALLGVEAANGRGGGGRGRPGLGLRAGQRQWRRAGGAVGPQGRRGAGARNCQGHGRHAVPCFSR